jgi:DNA-binding transcriptional regulator YdaS (Cro superfamily)
MVANMDKWDEALKRAISLAGNQAKLAKILNIGRSNISHWKRERAVPSQHALEIERLFGIDAQDFNRPRVAPGPRQF